MTEAEKRTAIRDIFLNQFGVDIAEDSALMDTLVTILYLNEDGNLRIEYTPHYNYTTESDTVYIPNGADDLICNLACSLLLSESEMWQDIKRSQVFKERYLENRYHFDIDTTMSSTPKNNNNWKGLLP